MQRIFNSVTYSRVIFPQVDVKVQKLAVWFRSLNLTVKNINLIRAFNIFDVSLHEFITKVIFRIFLYGKVIVKAFHNRRMRFAFSGIIDLESDTRISLPVPKDTHWLLNSPSGVIRQFRLYERTLRAFGQNTVFSLINTRLYIPNPA